MGWSCGSGAAKTERAWSEGCMAQTSSQNTFTVGNDKYFYEASRTEHRDGAITGSIHKFVGEDRARKSGTFRIEGDGTITRAPAVLKHFAERYKHK
jgi:hypothetical protein